MGPVGRVDYRLLKLKLADRQEDLIISLSMTKDGDEIGKLLEKAYDYLWLVRYFSR